MHKKVLLNILVFNNRTVQHLLFMSFIYVLQSRKVFAILFMIMQRKSLGLDLLRSYQLCWDNAFTRQACNQAREIAIKGFFQGNNIIRFELTNMIAVSGALTHLTTLPTATYKSF